MKVRLDNLISYEELKEDLDFVLKKVKRNGQVVILEDNKPAFIIEKYTDAMVKSENNQEIYTLHEAMRLVLLEKEDHTMHASDLADEIFKRRLYTKKNGKKAEYTQIRARCGNYPEMFEAMPGNMIRLKQEETF